MCMEITTTSRLLLRKISADDRELIFRLSEESTLLDNRNLTDGFREALQQYCWEEVNSADTYNCLVFRRDNGDFVGKVCMQYIDQPLPELGIDICRDHRGQGYGPEAIRAFCNWYAEEFYLSKVKVRINKGNTHSIHIFEKLGANFIGSTSFVSENALETIKELLPDANLSDLSQDSVREYILELPITKAKEAL